MSNFFNNKAVHYSGGGGSGEKFAVHFFTFFNPFLVGWGGRKCDGAVVAAASTLYGLDEYPLRINPEVDFLPCRLNLFVYC